MSTFTPRRRLSAILLSAGLAAPLALTTAILAQPAPDAHAELARDRAQADETVPIKRITLYRSGVGYFERAGTVTGDAEVQLRFTTEQINDILKSLVLLDLDGGRIDSVSYGSKEPLAKRLASFGINIADNPPASEILQRFRGTPVHITVPEGNFSGTIMNVESRPTVYTAAGGTGGAGGATVHNLPWINLLTDSGVRSFNMTNVTGFEILDAALAEELNKALSALAEYRADRTKTVDLRLTGEGSRKVMVGYIHEMPVWKTSYRLVLPPTDSPGGQLMLQGWAVVENTTDQDWNDVQLSLVSGRPVSFQMDLYEPLYMGRPWVSVPTIPGVSPRAYALGVDLSEAEELDMARNEAVERYAQSTLEARRNAGGVMGKSARGAVPPASAPVPSEDTMTFMQLADSDAAGAYAGVSAGQMADYAAAARATAAEVGEVFQFQVAEPVSLERQRSAMIPILSANITGRRVSIFNPNDGQPYPRRGVEITNDSNLQLLAGPISVFDSGAAGKGGDGSNQTAYAGDAQIGQIPQGDKRLLSYALDLNVNATMKTDGESTIQRIKIVDGLFEETIERVNTHTYEFSNRDKQRNRTIIVESPKFTNWDLVEPKAKPTEETPDIYRFELPVDAGKTGIFKVKQRIVQSQRLGITDYDLATITRFNSQGKASQAVVDAVKEIARRQSEINALEQQIQQMEKQTRDITEEQTRIRENMRTIDRTAQLYTRYMTKFNEQETRLEEISERKDQTQKDLNTARDAMNSFLRTLKAE